MTLNLKLPSRNSFASLPRKRILSMSLFSKVSNVKFNQPYINGSSKYCWVSSRSWKSLGSWTFLWSFSARPTWAALDDTPLGSYWKRSPVHAWIRTELQKMRSRWTHRQKSTLVSFDRLLQVKYWKGISK